MRGVHNKMESYLTQEQLSYFEEVLKEKRNKILSNLEIASSEVPVISSRGIGDESDYASLFQGYNTNQSISKKQIKMLEEIDLSLEKIEDGTYGICESCDEPIPIERLKVKPFARYCIICREEIEKREGLI